MENRHNSSSEPRRETPGRGRAGWHPKVDGDAALRMPGILRRQASRRWLTPVIVMLLSSPGFAETGEIIVSVSPRTGAFLAHGCALLVLALLLFGVLRNPERVAQNPA